MSVMEPLPTSTPDPTVGVIGDLIASRQAPDRVALQGELTAALNVTNRLVEAIEPLSITVGDEFQGRYASTDDALAATLVVQLQLGHDRVRLGLGLGVLLIPSTQPPFGQDGPLWWAARAALDRVGEEGMSRRALFAEAVGTEGAFDTVGARQLNSVLAQRDALLLQLDERDREIVLAMISGAGQREIGEQLGVSQPAISQRVRRRGLDLLAQSFRLLSRPSRLTTG